MRTPWPLFAMVAIGCAAGPLQDKPAMKLDLETTTTLEKNGPHVSASLRNAGRETVTVLLEPQLSNTHARLKDDAGKLLEAHDARAAQGSRFFQFGKIRVRVLRPGEAVEVDAFWLDPSIRRAGAGDLSWDLTDVRSATLTLEMIYVVTEEGARDAKALGAPDVAVGTWTSKPVTLRFRP
ncbi:MAG TPA: hypothetical protein VF950_02215 [Planctomycetota bacterium]